MASKISICNIALTMLGQSRSILSLDEDSKAARTFSALWDSTLEEVLRGHPWNFATKRIVCPALLTAPAFGYDFTYQLPSDCVRVLLVGEGDSDTVDYEIEGRTIVTDEAPCKLKYTARVTDTGLFDSIFTVILAARLAFYAAYAITAQPGASGAMQNIYKDAMSGGTAVDGQEASPKQVQANTWVRARQ